MMLLQAQQKGLTVHREFEQQLPDTVQVDEKRLRQILLNLLSNAVKFTDHGTITFQVLVKKMEPEQVQLYFEVRDTGIGIAPQNLEKIFQAFEQVGDSYRQNQGTGLGLAISRKLVRLMQGELQVASVLGEGSRFWFTATLPIVTRHIADATITGYVGNPRRILILSENSSEIQLWRHWLEPLTFQIAVMAGWQPAVAIPEPPDLILLKLSKPNGLPNLRQQPTWQKIPIIAIVDNTDQLTFAEELRTDFYAMLSKAFEKKELLELLQRALQLTWLTDQSSENSVITATSNPTIPIIPPALEKLQALYELAAVGKVTQVKAWIAMMRQETDNKRFEPFITQVEILIKSYRLKQLTAFIKEYLEKLS
jgi:CheY-like chemotaxis protein